MTFAIGSASSLGMAQFEALLFDMDGLLLDTERVAQSVFVELTTGYGVAHDEAASFFLTLVGTSSAVTRQRVQEFVPNIDIAAFDQAWTHGFRAMISQNVPLMPGVTDVLQELSQVGIPMAVVTSSSKQHALDNLTHGGLIGHFVHVTGGDEVSANKPDPAPYLETAERLGVNPARCAAFEDSDRGMTSAVRAGCTTVQIPDLRPLDAPIPKLGQAVAADLRSAMQNLGLL